MKYRRKAMFNKSIMAHRVYNFFHCYHGGFICAFAVILAASGIFVAINPLDIVWRDIFISLKEKINITVPGFSTSVLGSFIPFISPHFSFFSESLSIFEIICLLLSLTGFIAGIVCLFMRNGARCITGFATSFYAFSVFLLETLETVSGNFYEGTVVLWLMAAVVFMLFSHLVLGGELSDAFIRLILTVFLSVILGIAGAVLGAFPAMLSPVDDFDLYWITKLLCAGVMLAFALFQFDITLKIFQELSVIDRSEGITDKLNDMIGNEYIEGISGR